MVKYTLNLGIDATVMVNYTLNLGIEATVHGQLHTESGQRGCCSWSTTH